MLQRAKEWIRDPGRLLLAAAAVLLAAYVLRSCIPGLQRGQLPSEILELIHTRYVVCVTDTPIWPGEPRQPECGDLRTQVIGDGIIPAEQRAAGVSAAICFRATYTNPYWTTMGQTRHEIVEKSRTASKVAVLQHGTWLLTPDEDSADRQLWSDYACPAPYDSNADRSGG